MPDFTLEKDTFLIGKFEGWNPRTTYKLGNGTKWKLTRAKIRNLKRSQVRVKIWIDDRDRHYLEVNCIPGKFEVSQVL